MDRVAFCYGEGRRKKEEERRSREIEDPFIVQIFAKDACEDESMASISTGTVVGFCGGRSETRGVRVLRGVYNKETGRALFRSAF